MIAFPSSQVAAFFDIDGTLLAKPSLETRFFDWLVRCGAIPTRNYLDWLAEAVRLAPQGLTAVRHTNKMYLRGISYRELLARANSGPAFMETPSFLPDTLRRLTWHAQTGHAIFLVTGTLEPLAREVAQALATLIAIRRIHTLIGLRATRLAERGGRWTGYVAGQAMFGLAKATAIRKLASEMRLDLSCSYAYADSFTDLDMLEAVGNPVAVNPSFELRRLARHRAWPILCCDPAISSVEPEGSPYSSGLARASRRPFASAAFPDHEQRETPEHMN